VLDIRNNGGGSYGLAQAVAGRFTDRSRTAGYIRRRNGPAHTDLTDYMPEVVSPAGSAQFIGVVLLLTNRGTFSSGESFTLAMRSRANTTVVGDTTGGASGGPIVRELANGWTYQLSEWIEYTPDRRTFEGIGLAPDIVVKPTAADSGKETDAALDAALAIAAHR
jgi:C-terminal processing protease CtpA/Prc